MLPTPHERTALRPGPSCSRGLRRTSAYGLLCALLISACGKQGEGERCDINNSSLDCESGLRCLSGDQLNIENGRGVALCCPIEGIQPTVDACLAGTTQLPQDPLPPPEAPDAGDGGI